ncbi:hypothetical protein EVAR_71383_1 [Eumeta japonica]|uniref:Uncharacterized protein n=1 Tax=Eumeta variegata TaxID=151549 RepID=A0A4C1T2T7_EUMVA|nr:hypothetical protein EVAR_71383_1 [Eumeta japonica]
MIILRVFVSIIFCAQFDNIKTFVLEYKLPLPDRVPGQNSVILIMKQYKRLRLQPKQEGDTCSVSHVNACWNAAEIATEDNMREIKLSPPQTPVIANGHTILPEAECPADEPRLPKNLAIIKESIELCDEHLKS